MLFYPLIILSSWVLPSKNHLNLQALFQGVQNSNLRVKLKKWPFLQRKLIFLGHVVITDGVSADPSWAETWPTGKVYKDDPAIDWVGKLLYMVHEKL